MAKTAAITLIPKSCSLSDDEDDKDKKLVFKVRPGRVDGFPVIFWKTGQPWGEANDYLYSRADLVLSADLDVRTLHHECTALHAYANWLEETETDWRHWPIKRSERCLVRYRGALVNRAEAGTLERSTAAARIRVVLNFYRWGLVAGLIRHAELEMAEKTIRLYDSQGFPYPKRIVSSALAISNPSPSGAADRRLEDGAWPVSAAKQGEILRLAKEHASIELYYMLWLGFNTGMRLGSIADLKIQTLEKAEAIEGSEQVLMLSIGPAANPPVATKFGKSGRTIIAAQLRDELLEYANSRRRMQRERLARPQDKDVLFLTATGRRFAAVGLNRSSIVNSAMATLRRVARVQGVDMEGFRFHCTRASFATSFAEIGVQLGRIREAVAFLMEVLLHAQEATTWRYIRFVQDRKERAQLADRFTRETFGIVTTELEAASDA